MQWGSDSRRRSRALECQLPRRGIELLDGGAMGLSPAAAAINSNSRQQNKMEGEFSYFNASI